MHRAVRSLILLLLVLGVAGAALPEREPSTREEVHRANQEKLDDWKKDREHEARLQRDLVRFWDLPPEERDRLRRLDQHLNNEDTATQKRLWSVLERYHAWLERLPPAERRRVESARGADRLAVIKTLREEEWIRRLPPPQREHLLSLKGKIREKEIARLREEQRQRQVDPGRPATGRPRKKSELPSEVQSAVDVLVSKLNRKENDRLTRASGNYQLYMRTLVTLARQKGVPLPGLDTPGPKEIWEGLRGPGPFELQN